MLESFLTVSDIVLIIRSESAIIRYINESYSFGKTEVYFKD